MDESIIIVAIAKDDGTFVVTFDEDEDSKAEAFRQLSRWAADTKMPFTWKDALTLRGRIKQLWKDRHGT